MTGLPPEQPARRAIASAFPLALGLAGWATTSFLFFVLAGRVLGPGDYSVVAALLAIVVAAFIPMSALQLGMARPFAISDEAAGGLARRALQRSGTLGTLVLVVASSVAALVPMGQSEHPAVPLTALTTASIVAMAPMFLALGVLQGRGHDWGLAAVLIVWGIGRPLVFLALTPLLDDVTAVMAGNLVGGLVGLTAALTLTRRDLRGTPPADRPSWSAFARTLVGPITGMTGIAILMNADVVAGALALAPVDAGRFAAASQLAKAGLVIVPQALGLITVRRVAHRHHHDRETASIAALTATVSLLAGAAGIILCLLAAAPIMRIFGPDFEGGAWILVPMIAALLPFSLNYALVHHQGARNASSYSHALAAISVAAVIAFALAGRSVTSLLVIDAAAGLAGLIAHEFIHAKDGESLRAGFRNAARALGGAK